MIHPSRLLGWPFPDIEFDVRPAAKSIMSTPWSAWRPIVLTTMGLTVSDAFRIMRTRVARERALPFEPLVPNETTIAALREARAGNLPRVHGIAELSDALRAGG